VNNEKWNFKPSLQTRRRALSGARIFAGVFVIASLVALAFAHSNSEQT